MSNIHNPKSFLRGRNANRRIVNTYLNLRNARLKEEAKKERAEWAKTIKANGYDMPNPVRSYQQLHATRGFKTHAF